MKYAIFSAMLVMSVFKCTGATAEPSRSNERKEVARQIIEVAQGDPDAFDMERAQEEGIKYICEPAGYSTRLDKLCADYKRLK
jgi:hypothetical protein